MELLEVILKITVLILTTLIIIVDVRDLCKGYTFAFLFIYPAFYVFLVLPIILKMFWGTIDYGVFKNANVAMSDSQSICIYFTFIIFSSLLWFLFYRRAKRKFLISKKNEAILNSTNSIIEPSKYLYGNRPYVENGMFLITFMPIIYFLLHPSYWELLTYGAAYTNKDIEIIPSPIILIGVLGYLVYVLISKPNALKFLFASINLMSSLYIRGSRALVFTAVVFTIFALILSKKIKVDRAIRYLAFAIPLLLMFALWYQANYRLSSVTFYEYLSLDLSRDYTTIYSIYCELQGNMILNYRWETIIATLIFWIPRTIIPWKPYPFAQYMTISLMGGATSYVGSLGWATTTSIFSEFTANLGLIGLAVSVIFMQFFISKIDKVKNLDLRFILIFLLFYLITVEFQATAIGASIFLLYYFILSILQRQSDIRREKLRIQSNNNKKNL